MVRTIEKTLITGVLVHKLAPTRGGQGETEERGRALQVGRGRCEKQGKAFARLVSGAARRVDLCTHPQEC